MKYSFLLLFLLGSIAVNAQRKPNIKGNRIVTEVQQDLPEFHSVRLIDDLEVILETGAPGYSLEADDNLVDILKFEVISDTLRISSFYEIRSKKALEIRIRCPEYQNIILEDGSIEIPQRIQSDILNIEAHNLSRLQVRGKSALTTIKMDGQSKGEFNIESDSVNLILYGGADARVYAVGESSSLQMSDQSDAQLEGVVDHLTIQMSLAAELKAERLEAASVSTTLSGSAKAHVRAVNQIEISSGDAAELYLYGEPQISISAFKGSSELNKRSE